MLFHSLSTVSSFLLLFFFGEEINLLPLLQTGIYTLAVLREEYAWFRSDVIKLRPRIFFIRIEISIIINIVYSVV